MPYGHLVGILILSNERSFSSSYAQSCGEKLWNTSTSQRKKTVALWTVKPVLLGFSSPFLYHNNPFFPIASQRLHRRETIALLLGQGTQAAMFCWCCSGEVMLMSLAFLLLSNSFTKACKKLSLRALPPHQILLNLGRSSKVFWYRLTEMGPPEGPASQALSNSLGSPSHWKSWCWLSVFSSMMPFLRGCSKVSHVMNEITYSADIKPNLFCQVSFIWTNFSSGLLHWLHESSC